MVKLAKFGKKATKVLAVLAALWLSAQGEVGAQVYPKHPPKQHPSSAGSWTHVQDNPGLNRLTSPTVLTNYFSAGAFPSAVTVGNYVVVGISGYDGNQYIEAGDVFCTDNGSTPNSYRQLLFYRAVNGDRTCWVAAFMAKISSNPASGHLTPLVHIVNGKVTLMSLGAAEFSGGSTATDGSQVAAEQDYTAGAASLSFTVSTGVANDLLIGAFSDNRSGSYTWTLPSGFTPMGTQSDGADFVPGQLAYRIVSGTLSNQRLTWGNIGASQDGTVCAAIVAVQP
jgi:hypothetical protein